MNKSIIIKVQLEKIGFSKEVISSLPGFFSSQVIRAKRKKYPIVDLDSDSISNGN